MKWIACCLVFLCLAAIIPHTSCPATALVSESHAQSGNHGSPSISPYVQWENGPPKDPGYFPLAVWMQSPRHVREYQSIGINTFVGHWGDLNQADLDVFANSGMSLIVGQSAFAISAQGSSAIAGWLQPDEPDNAQPDGNGGYGPCIAPGVLKKNYARYRANDPSRPVLLGFGRGVSDVWWIGRGSCTGDVSYYAQAASAGDILAFDIYPVANGTGRLDDPAKGVRNLIHWSGGSKIIWNDIEASAIHGGKAPTASQVRSEVWLSIIAGSRGIDYFVHEFSPSFREDEIFNHPQLVKGVAALNKEVQSLAPVLNSRTIEGRASVFSSPSTVPVSFMMKKFAGAIYIFAAATADASAEGNFKLAGVSRGSAVVLGENREIRISHSIFRDHFAAYGVHLYRISLKQ